MPSAAALDLPTASVAQSGTVRLIASAQLKEPALAPLADGDDELDVLVSLEYATHGRLAAERRGLPDLHPRELVAGVPHAAFINAAFTYTRSGGNRFNDADRGAWYCAFEVETSLAEVPDLPGCMADGETEAEAVANAEDAIAEWIAAAREMGRDIPEPGALDRFSGKWVQRVPKSLHRKLAAEAKREGVSLNALATSLLAEGLGRKDTIA